MLQYLQFYKQYGIRRIQSLLYPKMINDLVFPRDSYLHLATHDDQFLDIDVSKPYLNNITRPIVVNYPDQLKEVIGKARHRNISIRPLLTKFHNTNKHYRLLTNTTTSINDPNSLYIANYNYLSETYTYPDMPLSSYYKFTNIQNTLFYHINELCNTTSKNHFVIVDLIDIIPSYTLLNLHSQKVTNITLKLFDTPDKLFILDIWKWLSEDNRENSVINNISHEHLTKVNIVFINKEGKSVVFNLGYIDSWLKGHDNLTLISGVTQYTSKQLQLMFIKFIAAVENDISETIVEDEEHILNEDNNTNGLPKHTEHTDTIIVDNDKSIMRDVEEDVKVIDQIELRKLNNRITEQPIEKTEEEIHNDIYQDPTPQQALLNTLDISVNQGLIGPTYKQLLKDIDSYHTLKDPYGSNKPISEITVIGKEDLKIDPAKYTMPDTHTVLDKAMLDSSLINFDSAYIDKVLRKDVLNSVNHIQKAGVIVKNHEINITTSVLGGYENHTLELKPIDGAPSTIKFRLPVISKDGSFLVNGNKYIKRKSRIDLPIRKINPYTVALTSYYGKNFVTRSQKKSDSSLEWLIKQINLASITENSNVSSVIPADVFDNLFTSPFIYGALSHNFKSFKVGSNSFYFDSKIRSSLVNIDLSLLEKDGKILTGVTDSKQPILVDTNNQFYIWTSNELIELGDIFSIFNLPLNKAPVDYSEMRIYSKTVPTGIILGYFLGFNNLLKHLKVQYRTIKSGSQKKLYTNEYAVTFKDITYIFSRKDVEASLLLGGFADLNKMISGYNCSEFNTKHVYFNILTSKLITSVYIRELELMNQMFVDPITKGILEERNEPVTLLGILIKANSMLTSYNHPDPQDLSLSRIRGYERIPGAVYNNLTAAIRQYKNRNISGRSKIDISPYEVWTTITKDTANKIIEDTNPVQSLKEFEALTYLGEGGRSRDAINKQARTYHKNDIGVISEATVDSSDVGVNTYLSSNPKISDLRGIIKDDPKVTTSNLMSTSFNLAPFADRDDPKRINFISIMNTHTISSIGYHQPYIRTGYESIIANRTTDMFAVTAKQNGKVLSKTNLGIIVEYEDGNRNGVSLGRNYGKAEGSYYPFDIITNLNVNDIFTKGDIIAYNTGFFEKDLFNPKRVVMKNSLSVKTVLYETLETHEDSSAISKEYALKLSSYTTKVKSIVVDFNQNLVSMVKPQQNISASDTLVIIEDEITSKSSFDEESLSVLKKLSNQAPVAKYDGIVDRIEVYYHGDKEDMSSSLLELTNTSDKLFSTRAKSSNNPSVSGRVNDDYLVAGNPLLLNKAEIKIYITVFNTPSVGDKVVFGNQMKSTFGAILNNEMHTESGDKVEAAFGYRSILARAVNSPLLIGTTTTLLKVITKKAVEMYR